MTCEHWKVKGGGDVFLCFNRGRRGRAALCSVCGRASSLLCDGKLEGTDKTCDAPLCRSCARTAPATRLVVLGGGKTDAAELGGAVVDVPTLYRRDSVDFCPRCASTGGRPQDPEVAVDKDEHGDAYKPPVEPVQGKLRHPPAPRRADADEQVPRDPECQNPRCRTRIGPGQLYLIPAHDDLDFTDYHGVRKVCGRCCDLWNDYRRRVGTLPG